MAKNSVFCILSKRRVISIYHEKNLRRFKKLFVLGDHQPMDY